MKLGWQAFATPPQTLLLPPHLHTLHHFSRKAAAVPLLPVPHLAAAAACHPRRYVGWQAEIFI
jgi:hypothetical protein